MALNPGKSNGLIQEKVDSLRASRQESRLQYLAALQNGDSAGKPRLIVGENSLLCEYTLEQAMMFIALDDDVETGLSLLRQTGQLCRATLLPALVRYEEFLRLHPDRFAYEGLSISELWYPFCVLAMTGAQREVLELSQWAMRTPPVRNNKRPETEFASMMLAFARRDTVEFERARNALDDIGSFNAGLYIELGEFARSALDGDADKFDAMSRTLAARYEKRNRISTNRIPASFGPSGYNEVYMDYASAVIIRLAVWNGMSAPDPGAAIPAALLQAE